VEKGWRRMRRRRRRRRRVPQYRKVQR